MGNNPPTLSKAESHKWENGTVFCCCSTFQAKSFRCWPSKAAVCCKELKLLQDLLWAANRRLKWRCLNKCKYNWLTDSPFSYFLILNYNFVKLEWRLKLFLHVCVSMRACACVVHAEEATFSISSSTSLTVWRRCQFSHDLPGSARFEPFPLLLLKQNFAPNSPPIWVSRSPIACLFNQSMHLRAATALIRRRSKTLAFTENRLFETWQLRASTIL